MSRHEHQPTVATRPKGVTNICRCGHIIWWSPTKERWEARR